ncbi:response regulator transcription factor [Vibrio sp. TMPB1044]|uniref:response regulator transcription factor n=1 Tax=Vibrio sp. TMPB1044 TaxID=3051822 RepID=UPI00255BA107|nr:response regulator transcription factor [Vibrio sp. TMPB1044]MDL5027204.1 response regulator transcription factor [Vibrio sp. TMPB1044]MDN5207332.1 response regulator transcription factor [Vibrio sp. TMPB1044]
MNCLIFDDHPLVCVAIKSLVEFSPHIAQVNVASELKAANEFVRNSQIDLLILDVNLDDCDGFDFYRRIKSHGFRGRVVFYSAETSAYYSEMAFKVGAHGYVCKSEHYNVLKDAIEAIVKGYSFFKEVNDPRKVGQDLKLSPRETTVAKLLLKGMTNKDIAELLSISEKTISTYKSRILTKYSVDNIIELYRVIDL